MTSRARAELEVSDEARTRVRARAGRFEVVDGCIEVVFHRDPVRREGVGDLHGSLHVVCCVIRQHPAKHGDVHGARMLLEDECLFGFDLLTCEQLVGESKKGAEFVLPQMDELVGFDRRAVIV